VNESRKREALSAVHSASLFNVVMRFSSLRGVFTRLGQVTSTLAAALIAMMVIGSVSPETHERLCHHHADDVDASHYVIKAFSAGEAYAVPVIIHTGPEYVWVAAVSRHEVRQDLPVVAYRLLPSRGPPSVCPLA
jgi:hypothetical protein